MSFGQETTILGVTHFEKSDTVIGQSWEFKSWEPKVEREKVKKIKVEKGVVTPS